jgi:HlyD family secretion protein
MERFQNRKGKIMRNKLIFTLSITGVLIGCLAAYFFGIKKKPLPPAFNPAANPYVNGIYANGIIESEQSSGENMNVYPEVPGTVKVINVTEGQVFQKGATLLEIEDSIQRAAFHSAQATFQTMLDTFRKQEAAYKLDPRSVSKDALDSARNAVAVARANLEMQSALLAKYTLKAPSDGVVLAVNAAVGSFVSPQGTYDTYTQGSEPVLVLGAPQTHLQVRCYVDEILVPRLPPPSRINAQMAILGSDVRVPLEFVRVQPFVSPKIELSDQKLEQVDVRVLPVIFRIEKTQGLNLYPGELVDVYIGE